MFDVGESKEERDIRITYETLFEIQRRERETKELQKLDDSFFKDVLNYFKEKQEVLSKLSAYSEDEVDRIKTQIHNAKLLLKKIYDAREKKIVEKAIIKARTKSDIINTENLLKEEKILFDKLVDLLSEFRNNLLMRLIEGKDIIVKEEKKEKEEEKKEKDRAIVRFLTYVPKFVGIDGKVYGPFSTDEVAVLPMEIVKVLVDKEKVEVIDEEENVRENTNKSGSDRKE